jgi:nitrogen fixation protein FixH
MTKAVPMTSPGGLTGRHVLAGMVLFFGTIFAVNGYMLYSALSTHTGIVSAEPYRKGLAYNERILADERQTALGWTSELALSMDGTVDIRLTDSSGAGVSGRQLAATLGRPATNAFDRSVALKERAAGQYVASVGAIGEGAWLLDFEVRDGASAGTAVYRARKRIWLKR